MSPCMFFLLCTLDVLLLHEVTTVSGYYPLSSMFGRPCYEDFCRCDDHVADCSYSNHLHFIPKLPPGITELDFSYSGIQRIGSADFFSNVTSNAITGINLEFNGLSYIAPGAFDGFVNLTSLDLSDNSLTSLPTGTFSPSMVERLQKADFGQNNFECGCDMKWFAEWYASKPEVFKDSYEEMYKCNDIMRGQRDIVILLSIAQQPCIFGPQWCFVIAIVSGIILLPYTFLVVVVACAKTCSKPVAVSDRYMPNGVSLVLRKAISIKQRIRRMAGAQFKYDVFVSFAEEDKDVLMTRLAPVLENRLKLSLCIHHRDFHPGRNVLDNIQDCVEKSRRFLMIFSSHFAASPWCQFELQLCQRLAMERQVEMMVIVVNGAPGTQCEVTPAMDAIMKTHTYIPWNQQAVAGRGQFWNSVLVALADVMALQQGPQPRRRRRRNQRPPRQLQQLLEIRTQM